LHGVNRGFLLEQVLRQHEAVPVKRWRKTAKWPWYHFATRYPEKICNWVGLVNQFWSIASWKVSTWSSCQASSCNVGYVIPEDVRAEVHDVLRHRTRLLMQEAENISAD
jgi:MoxR-like ATPase